MAQNENIGGVSVLIGGDYSPLVSALGQAQTIAQRSGQAIGTAFTAGAQAAPLLYDQFGRAIQSVGTAAAAATPAVLDLTGGVQRLAFAQALLAQMTEEANVAGAHQVTQIQAVGGAIRTGFGEQSIRAVERFLTMIPGVGVALQAAFPIIGAVALGEMLSRVAEKFTGLSEAEKELTRVTQQNDTEWERLANQFEHTEVERMTRAFGQLAGLKLKGITDAAAVARDQRELDNLATKIERLKKEVADSDAFSGHPYLDVAAAMGGIQDPVTLGKRAAQKTTADQQADLKALQDQYGTLDEKIRESNKQIKADEEGRNQLAARQAGEQTAARLANEEAANTRYAELFRMRGEYAISAAHATAQATIDASTDELDRLTANSAEQVRVAKEKQALLDGIALATRDRTVGQINQRAGAESQGKNAVEQKDVRIKAEGELAAAVDAYSKQILESQQLVDAAQQKSTFALIDLNRKVAASLEEVSRKFVAENAAGGDWLKILEEANRLVSEQVAKNTQVLEIQDRSKGQTDDLKIQGQKIALEGQYAAQLVHTSAQHIAYLTQITALEEQANAAKIKGLELERDVLDADKDRVRVAEIQAQIDAARQQGANRQTAARGQIATAKAEDSPTAQLAAQLGQWKNQNLSQEIGLAVERGFAKVPQALGHALASGIFGGGKKGEDVGKQVGDALKGIGKQILGQAFSSVIEKLIAEIAVQTGLQAAFNAIFGAGTTAQVTATTANTIAVSANTAAQVAARAAGLASSAAGGGAASAAGSAVSQAASGLVGPLIAAAGGIIGGAISAVSTWISGNKIVRAIDGTTAAVNALGSRLGGSTGLQTGTGPGSTASSAQTTTALNSITASLSTVNTTLGHIPGLAGILGGFGLGGGVAVRIVGIDPGVMLGSQLAGGAIGALLGLFGFADGGSPPIGVPSVVGERGPEIFVPRQAGTIIPNHQIKAYAEGAGPSLSISSGSGGDTMHFHGAINLHGIQNVRQMAEAMYREIPRIGKNRTSKQSPYSR